MAQRVVHYSPEMVEDTKQIDVIGVRWVDAAEEGKVKACDGCEGQLDVVATQVGMHFCMEVQSLFIT